MVLVLTITILAVYAGLTTSPAHAAGPWYVGPGGNDSNACTSPATRCATINGALNKAGFVAGDTIRVQTGTYTGSGDEVVLLNKNATLSGGWNSAFSTQNGMSTIDGQGARRGVMVNIGVTARVERFVVQNGQSIFDAGGIYNFGNLTLVDNLIQNNRAGSGNGGGVFNTSPGIITITNSIIRDNTADFGGGALNNNSTMTLNNSTIRGNANNGITNWNSGVLNLNSSTISGNSGGGIYNSFSTATLNNSMRVVVFIIVVV
jgi:hypothetical protein